MLFSSLWDMILHLGSTCCWHKWHEWRRVRSESSPLTCAVKVHIQNEEGMGADEVGQFFVTGATDAAGKPSHFYCRICRKDVSVLTHGPHEVLRNFQGVKHFARDQRLRLETAGWWVLDFEGNPLTESELDRRRESILQGPLVIRDREYPLAEDGSDCGWFWSSRCQVTSSCEGVIAGWSVATGWVLRVGSSAVVAIHNNCQPSEHRRNMVSGWGVGWHLLFRVSTYPCALT